MIGEWQILCLNIYWLSNTLKVELEDECYASATGVKLYLMWTVAVRPALANTLILRE